LRSGRRPLLPYRALTGRQKVAQRGTCGRSSGPLSPLVPPWVSVPMICSLSPNTFSVLGERVRVRGKTSHKPDPVGTRCPASGLGFVLRTRGSASLPLSQFQQWRAANAVAERQWSRSTGGGSFVANTHPETFGFYPSREGSCEEIRNLRQARREGTPPPSDCKELRALLEARCPHRANFFHSSRGFDKEVGPFLTANRAERATDWSKRSFWKPAKAYRSAPTSICLQFTR
jgi:hypothetical protein